MKQIASVLSTYAADVSGVCSALYELGGLTVMHDASGCNSTYNTHDEPRWYDMDSMVYISALSEMEAVMGDDEKLIGDITDAAKELSPRFIAVAGTPIPMMMGTDLRAIASVIEHRTGIPTFGFPTNSMHSYLSGVSMALEAFARRMCRRDVLKDTGPRLSVNILGVTPLDFSVTGSVETMRKLLSDRGYNVIGCWAMGSAFEELAQAGRANVNIVVSYGGLAAAKALREIFGTPYVVGVPIGEKLTERLLDCAAAAVKTGENQIAYSLKTKNGNRPLYIVGESVFSESLRFALSGELGSDDVRVICPLETEHFLLQENDSDAQEEDEIHRLLSGARGVIADPIYRRACPEEIPFYSLPHEAYSGRIYRKNIPVLIGNAFTAWAKKEELTEK